MPVANMVNKFHFCNVVCYFSNKYTKTKILQNKMFWNNTLINKITILINSYTNKTVLLKPQAFTNKIER